MLDGIPGLNLTGNRHAGILLEPCPPWLLRSGKAKAPIAMEALQRIAALYEVEDRVRGKAVADRLAARRAGSQPLISAMQVWFEAQLAKLPGTSPTAEAIRML